MTDPTPAALQVAEHLLGVMVNTACPCDACKRTRLQVYAIAAAIDQARRDALTALQSEIAALPAPRGTLVQATVLDLIAAKLKGGDS